MAKKNRMHIPDGYTKEQVIEVVDEVVAMLGSKFKFGSYETADMMQEGWLFALDGLKNFNPNKGATLKTFLFTHVRNRFISFKRDKWYRPAPKDITPERLEKWKERNMRKRSLAQPYTIEDKGPLNENSHAFDLLESISRAETFERIDRELPVEYRRDFMLLLDDCTLPKLRRDRLIEKIREILDDEEG